MLDSPATAEGAIVRRSSVIPALKNAFRSRRCGRRRFDLSAPVELVGRVLPRIPQRSLRRRCAAWASTLTGRSERTTEDHVFRLMSLWTVDTQRTPLPQRLPGRIPVVSVDDLITLSPPFAMPTRSKSLAPASWSGADRFCGLPVEYPRFWIHPEFFDVNADPFAVSRTTLVVVIVSSRDPAASAPGLDQIFTVG
jgi:hypothetical protein